jgi:hypothetical protein
MHYHTYVDETTIMPPLRPDRLPSFDRRDPDFRVNAATASEIQAVAQKYLNPYRAHIVAVGDASKIRPALAKLGAVEGPVV